MCDVRGLRWLFAIFCFVAAAQIVAADGGTSTAPRCVLPVPDGDGPTPSRANLHGDIVKVADSAITLRAMETQKTVSVRVDETTALFTVFGGDFQPSAFKLDQEAWVWFENCKNAGKGIPTAAVIQIYSTDPADRNPERKK